MAQAAIEMSLRSIGAQSRFQFVRRRILRDLTLKTPEALSAPNPEQVDFHRSAQLPSTVGDERARNQPFDNTPQHYGASAAPLAPNLWGRK